MPFKMTTMIDRELAAGSNLSPDAAVDRLTSLYETATQSLKQAL
jgi:hypothetical protein